MIEKDYGSTIMFFGDAIKYAELHFTGDFGRVLVIYPNALARDSRRQWKGVQSVRAEYQADFKRIFAKWNIDRISVLRY